MAKFKLIKFIKSEEGSISFLLVFFFLIAAISSLIVIDIADGYLAKRQLAQVGEAAANIGSHQIDLNRYYSEGLVDNGMGFKQVPLDCNSALVKSQSFINSNAIRGNQIYLVNWSCNGDRLMLNLQSSIRPLIQLPIVTSTVGGSLRIYAKVIASAVIR
jgi:hypothetical protein